MPTAEIVATDETPIRFLFVDRNERAVQWSSRELARVGIEAEDIVAVTDAGAAMRFVTTQRASMRFVAFVAWSLEHADARVLVATLRAAGAFVVATLPRGQWQAAADAYGEGADDVLLTPAPAHGLAVRALVAREAVRRARPAPWHRLRAVLHEALAHPIGGEVVVRGSACDARIVVSRGRVAWVHDHADRGAFRERLRAHGVDVTAEELTAVLAECQRTREHFADVLARWGLADRDAIVDAIRSLVDARLRSAMARRDAAALFVPAHDNAGVQVAFELQELSPAPRTVPPPGLGGPSGSIVVHPEMVARADAIVAELRALTGCAAAAVFHTGAASVVSAAAEDDVLSIGWTLGAALEVLDDARADVFASNADRCHVARRLAGAPDCFAFAIFDLATTSLAMGRLGVAAIVERSCARSANDSDAPTGER